MTWVQACVGLGSNVGDGVQTLREAIDVLAASDSITVSAVSPFYRSSAWGVVDQPDFVNAVVLLGTSLAPRALLDALIGIERRFGRNRGIDAQRWGPRTLDLDLLLHGDVVVDSTDLRVPHPHMHERAFVLRPLLDVMPGAVIPGIGPAHLAYTAVQADGMALRVIDALPYGPPRSTRD